MSNNVKIANCEVSEESLRDLLELYTMLPPFPFRLRKGKAQERHVKLAVQPKDLTYSNPI